MKKIAILADGWKKYITYAWVAGSRQYIREHKLDANIYFFNSFGNYSMDEKYNLGEYNIWNLPDLTQFDGIIFEFANVEREKSIKEKIIAKIVASGVPAVSLVEKVAGCYYAGIDNYAAMVRMMEHVITEHGCRTLNFVGGPSDNEETKKRMQAYKDVLAKHGIPVEQERIYCDNYEIRTGEEGFDYFKENSLLADAFICANDNIAVGVCHEAQRLGYMIPHDFLVTGFDNFDKASYYQPRISTMGFEREEIAYKAVGLLERIWNGDTSQKEVFATVESVYQDSCGCPAHNPKDRSKYIIDHIFGEVMDNELTNELLELKREMVNCKDFEDIAERLPRKLYILKSDALYIMLDRDILKYQEICNFEIPERVEIRTDGYPEDMKLLLAFEDGQQRIGWTRKPGCLLPEEDGEEPGNMYFFSALHFRDQEVGYTVMKNCDYIMNSQLIFEILTMFQETMENIYHRMILDKMNEELSQLYIRDSLTGLYNRMAYNRLAVPLYEKQRRNNRPLAILFVDADRLKYINDNYGHDMGNIAIKTVSAAIEQACPKEAVALRYGGDEFIVMLPDCTEDQTKQVAQGIEQHVAEIAEKLDLNFPIAVSIGYALADESMESLNDCINLADERMYEVKKAKKVQRGI